MAPRESGLKAGSHPSGIFGNFECELPIALRDGCKRSDFPTRLTICGIAPPTDCGLAMSALAGADSTAINLVPDNGVETARVTPMKSPTAKLALNLSMPSIRSTLSRR